MKRLREIPARRLFGTPAFALAMGLCIWATLARGLFDGAMLLTGMCGVFSLGLILLPSRPRLRVEVRDENPLRLQLTPSWSARPFDIPAIVRGQANQALATLPEPMRSPPFEPQSKLSEAFSALSATGGIRSLTSATEEERQGFESEVDVYRRELKNWLEEVEHSRDEHRKIFECDLRLRELGHAAADHVHLRLRFPKGFLLARKLPLADEPPPPRPNYLPAVGVDYFARLNINRMPGINDIDPIRLPGTDKPNYSLEDDEVVIDYQLGRVNQGDHRDVPTFSLRVPEPGTYKVHWEASASGLGKPARGFFEIDFAQPKQGQPIDTLAEAEAEQEKTLS